MTPLSFLTSHTDRGDWCDVPHPDLEHFTADGGDDDTAPLWRGVFFFPRRYDLLFTSASDRCSNRVLRLGDAVALIPCLPQADFEAPRQGFLVLSGATTPDPDVPTESESGHRVRWLYGEAGGLEPLEKKLEELLKAAAWEDIEPGMQSILTQGLDELLATAGDRLWRALEKLIKVETKRTCLLSEVLRWAGHVDVPIRDERRLALMRAGLGHHSSLVRDAAVCGLSYLDDPFVIEMLRDAPDRESIPELKQDIEDTTRSLAL